jgi:hypothetical protein
MSENASIGQGGPGRKRLRGKGRQEKGQNPTGLKPCLRILRPEHTASRRPRGIYLIFHFLFEEDWTENAAIRYTTLSGNGAMVRKRIE